MSLKNVISKHRDWIKYHVLYEAYEEENNQATTHFSPSVLPLIFRTNEESRKKLDGQKVKRARAAAY